MGLSSRFSCLGPGSCSSHKELCQGNFAYARIKPPLAWEDNRARSELIQAQPEHIKTGAPQRPGWQSTSQSPATSWNQEQKTLRRTFVQVTLSELRNDSSFSFLETELRHPFLCSRAPCQMLISNVTFTPHLQGDVYLQCNQGKASIHQTAFLLINPRIYAEVQTL